MKFTNKLAAIMMALVLVLPVLMTGCNSSDDLLYYEYNYDLSDYITLGEYKGIPVVGSVVAVTKEEVDMQIQAVLSSYGDVQNITDRPYEVGDTVIYRCHVTLDGKEIEDLYEESGTIMLGQGNYGEDVDNALIGSNQGDTVYAKRLLDAIYGEYAGKTVDYELYVLGGYTVTMPDYTDNFVKAYWGFDTIEAFETHVYNQLMGFRQANYLNYLVSQTWTTVVENTEVIKYPEKELNELKAYYTNDIMANAAAMNVEYEKYLNTVYGQTVEEFEAGIMEKVKADLKQDMIVYAIARAENLSVSEEKYKEYLNRFIENYDEFMYEYEVENTFGKELLMSEVLEEVVKEYVAEVANVTIPNTAN